jgi:leucyl aminopeptidase
MVAIQAKAEKDIELLSQSGWQVFERLVEFPSWDDYAELMKSDIADLKNLGPPEAGAITAAKFLQKFTGSPYIHLDIAGPAYLEKRDSYRGQGGTGVGVRLLLDFIKRKIQSSK